MLKLHSITLLTKKNITLVYHDNGHGFDASCKEAKPGMGLMNIQERIRILGGNFRIESVIGKGCTIFVDFPVNEANKRIEAHSLQNVI